MARPWPALAFYADVIRRLDTASFEQLRTGDETLGSMPLTYIDQSTRSRADRRPR